MTDLGALSFNFLARVTLCRLDAGPGQLQIWAARARTLDTALTAHSARVAVEVYFTQARPVRGRWEEKPWWLLVAGVDWVPLPRCHQSRPMSPGQVTPTSGAWSHAYKETSALLSSSPSSHTERGISRLEFLGKLSFDKTRLLAMPIRNVDKRLCLCQHVREKYTKIAATLTRSNNTDDANHLTFMVGFYCHWMNINFSIIIWYFARIMITVTGSSKYRVVLYLLRLNDEVIVFVVEWV